MLTIQECYEILGLHPNASSQDVRNAYIKLVKQWHPDASRTHPSQAQERLLRIQKAYEQLKQYQESTAPPQPQTPASERVDKVSAATSKVSTSRKAEMLYDNAVELGKKGLYRDAIAELSVAIRIDPNYALAYQYRGHLKSLLGLERQAEADLNKANVLNAMGTSAAYRSPAEIESLARGYSWRKVRSRFRRHGRSSQSRTSQKQFLALSVAGIILAAGTGALLYMRSISSSTPSYPPLNIESPSLES